MPDHDLFEQTLFSISDPDHPDYGKHLSREKVKVITQILPIARIEDVLTLDIDKTILKESSTALHSSELGIRS
jgi:hypothetical protein